MTNTQITLAGNCLLVKGYSKNLLIDIQNNCWYHVEFDETAVSDAKKFKTLQPEVRKHLLEHQIVTEIPKYMIDRFPKINTSFDIPSHIESVIIDRNTASKYSIVDVLHWVQCLHTKYIQLRYFQNPLSDLELNSILSYSDSSIIESLEFIIPYDSTLVNYFGDAITKFPKIHRVIFHSCPEPLETGHPQITCIEQVITSSNQCGVIQPILFSNHRKHVLKSINYNSCLYKKIGVDVNGNIRNCPSAHQIIGHVDQLDQLSTKQLETPLWYIKKDDVAVCKDCEFRYICTDCRIRTVDGEYSRPETCPYNPYTNTWRGQEGYEEPEKYRK